MITTLRTTMVLALLACTSKGEDGEEGTFESTHPDEDDTASEADDTGGSGSGDDTGDTAQTCEGSVPVTVVASCDYPGLSDANGYPQIAFVLEVDDDDGDLEQYTMRYYVDAEPDGTIDPESVDANERDTSTVSDAEECAVQSLTIGYTLTLSWDTEDLGVEYDWGFSVADRHGYWSDIAVITCSAPNEDGTEP